MSPRALLRQEAAEHQVADHQAADQLPKTIGSLGRFVAVFSFGAATAWLNCHVAQGQVSDSLANLLNLPQTQTQAQVQDELPPPARSSAAPKPAAPKPAAPAPAVPAQAPTQETPDEIPASERIYLGLEAEQAAEGIGVLVTSVNKDSPAWKAGFRIDDRILGINGFAIGKMDDMVEQLSKTRPGQSVNFLVNREGRNAELVAVLMNAELADRIQTKAPTKANVPAWLGVTAHDLSNVFRDQFGIAAYQGAAVTQVVNGSPAYQGGIRPGDAITEIGGRAVESAAEVQRWIESSKPGDQAQIVFYRGNKRESVKVVLVGDPQFLASQPQSQKPPAFPRNSTGLGPARPGPAVDPTGRPNGASGVNVGGNAASNSTADPNSPLMLTGPKTPPPIPTNPALANDTNALPGQTALTSDGSVQPTEREVALEAEVAKLRKELADSQAKLAEMKLQLDNILKALRD